MLESMTDLPSQYAAALCAQQQHRVAGSQRNAVDPLWERHDGFLVTLFPAVHVDNGLLSLRSKYMRAAHGDAVWGCCTLFEDMSLRRQWLVLVHENARILCDARVGLGRGRDARDDEFCEHRLVGVGGFGCCRCQLEAVEK